MLVITPGTFCSFISFSQANNTLFDLVVHLLTFTRPCYYNLWISPNTLASSGLQFECGPFSSQLPVDCRASWQLRSVLCSQVWILNKQRNCRCCFVLIPFNYPSTNAGDQAPLENSHYENILISERQRQRVLNNDRTSKCLDYKNNSLFF